MDERWMVDAALGVLPPWVRLGPYLLIGPGLALLTAGGMRALVWGLTRRLPPADAHWSARAAALWPARRVAGGVVVWALVLLVVILVTGEVRPPVPTYGWGALGVVAVWAGARAGSTPLARLLGHPSQPWAEAARSAVGLSLAMYGHLLLALVIAALMPPDLPLAWLGLGIVAVVVTLSAAAGEHLEPLRWLGVVRAADDRARRIVARAADAAGVRPPEARVVPSVVANAFVFPLGHRVAFTTRALAELDDDELAAVTAHELEHLTEHRSMKLARVVGACAPLPLIYLRPVLEADSLVALGGMLAVLAVAAGGAAQLRRAATRMEERADAAGRRAEGDPGVYGRALERIYAVNGYPAVTGGRKVHPDLYDRLVAAGAPPEWPRPARPSALAPRMIVAGMVLSGGMLLLGPLYEPMLLGPPTELRHELRLAVGLGRADDLGGLGAFAVARGEHDRALPLLLAAANLEPFEERWLAELALLHAGRGDCPAAVEALRAASATLAGGGDAWEDGGGEAYGGEDAPWAGGWNPDPAYFSATEAVRACLGEPPR